jgi:DNA/RNA-binding domain of Phe-tRNA-synthetase-like protein
MLNKKQVLCIYPYRDLDYTKITEQTENGLIVGHGALGIAEQHLTEAAKNNAFIH